MANQAESKTAAIKVDGVSMSATEERNTGYYELEGLPDDENNPEEFTIFNPEGNVATEWITTPYSEVVHLNQKR